MIYICRVCQIRAGGLVLDRYRPLRIDWPEDDLCLQCAEKLEKDRLKALEELSAVDQELGLGYSIPKSGNPK
jgi:hypothetical protein